MARLGIHSATYACAESIRAQQGNREEVGVCTRSHSIRIRRCFALFSFLLALCFSAEAWSAPISYSVTGGSVTISVAVGGTVLGSTTSPLTQGGFTTDSSSQSLNDFSITLEPDIVLSLSSAYAGYDTVTIESATLSAAPGFSSTLIGSAGSTYTVLASPLGVSGSWGGSNSAGTPAPVSNQPISYPVPSMTAVIGNAPLIYVNAVTLTSLDGSLFGESNDLVVLASINVDSAIVIPEPQTALLLGFGLLGLGLRRRILQAP